VVGNVRDYIKIKLDSENSAQIARKSFQYDAGFTLEPGRYRMKFLVRENVSGKMGTFDTKFVVPDLSADTSGLKLSSVIWSSQREPIKAAVGAAEKVTRKDGRSQSADPARRRRRREVAPQHYPRLPPQSKSLRDLRCLRRPPRSGQHKIAARESKHEPVQSGRDQSVRDRTVRRTQLADTRPETVPVSFTIPLKDLAPGRYTSQINVVDQVGRKFAFPRSPLVVVP